MRPATGRRVRLARVSLALVVVLGAAAVGIAPEPNFDPVMHPPEQSWAPDPPVTSVHADVVVYGATASGVMAAIAAASEGRSVALVEPTHHVGGMVTGGISLTDVGNRSAIGGLALDFYRRVADFYDLLPLGVQAAWNPEPHAAAEILAAMLREGDVPVYLGQRLRLPDGVVTDGTTITALRMESGAEFTGSVFVDSSYEGDLMAAAGVSFRVGREARDEYGEGRAGARRGDRVYPPVAAHYFSGEMAPLTSVNPPPGPPGSADERVQPYNFRLCFSSVPGNQIPFPRPAGYDLGRFLLLQRILDELEERGQRPVLTDILVMSPIPNGKVDVNAASIAGTDLIGGSWAYPDAGYEERARIWAEHFAYDAGLVYYLANEPTVPNRIRDELGRWGLCRDEWASTGGWPPQLYVREARRMVNGSVLTQRDLVDSPRKADAIGLGSYRVDAHTVSQYEGEGRFLYTEGALSLAVPEPYQVPYGILVPDPAEVGNLLVTVTVAASHVAWASLRMEPQFMIMGEAAGVAASLAVRDGIGVADVPAWELQRHLRLRGSRIDPLGP